jgi:hypothetical protein
MIAAGFLCAVAATVAVWSGPLAAASADLRTAATPSASHQQADVHTGRASTTTVHPG